MPDGFLLPRAEGAGEGDREAVEGASAATLLVIFVDAEPSKFDAARAPSTAIRRSPSPTSLCDAGEERGSSLTPDNLPLRRAARRI